MTDMRWLLDEWRRTMRTRKPRSVVLLLALLLKKWAVEKQSSPFRNILSFELHIVFNIFNKYIVLKLWKMWFSLYFLWIQIQISRINCNHPIRIQDFYLIKRLTPWRSTAAFGSGPLISAYFLCGPLLNIHSLPLPYGCSIYLSALPDLVTRSFREEILTNYQASLQKRT